MKPRYWLERKVFARVVLDSVEGYGPGAGFGPIFVEVCHCLRSQRIIAPFQLLPNKAMVATILYELVEAGVLALRNTCFIGGHGRQLQARWFMVA
ncbi:MAG: hypothetical protein RLZZ342_745 [Candidatus Parcubacteria bacterium]|jgi:hypothetical protein